MPADFNSVKGKNRILYKFFADQEYVVKLLVRSWQI